MADNIPSYAHPIVNTSKPGQSAAQTGASAAVQSRYVNMYENQSYKKLGKTKRFTMVLNNIPNPLTFTAHLDPQDISLKQSKRIASLDVLTGVVLQDFGYKAQILEVKGTTGSAYYTEIATLDGIFNNQNYNLPIPITVTLENTTYQAVWTDFQYGRQINATAGNLIQYAMSFTILSRSGIGAANADNIASQSPAAQSAATQNPNGSPTTQDIAWNGSMNNYINKTAPLPRFAKFALNYLIQSWNINLYGPVPKPDQVIKSTQKLTVPVNWNDILSPFYATPTSSTPTALTTQF